MLSEFEKLVFDIRILVQTEHIRLFDTIFAGRKQFFFAGTATAIENIPSDDVEVARIQTETRPTKIAQDMCLDALTNIINDIYTFISSFFAYFPNSFSEECIRLSSENRFTCKAVASASTSIFKKSKLQVTHFSVYFLLNMYKNISLVVK